MWDIPSNVRTQASMAISAPVLSPAGKMYASALQVWAMPSASQSHTLMVRVLVLLSEGEPLSTMNIGK